MSTYYIAASGLDSNPGTISQPFQTVSHWAGIAVVGDIGNLNGGDTFTENPSFSVGVTIQSYGSGQATLAGGTGNALLIVLSADQAITLSNVIYTNSSTVYSGGASTQVVFLTQATTSRFNSGLTVTGCTFTGGQNGLRINATNSTGGGWNGVTVSSNLFYNCSLTGMYIQGAGTLGTTKHYNNVTVTNNIAHDITGNTLNSGTGYGWGLNISYLDSASGSNLVSGNLAYNCGANSSNTTIGGCLGIQMLGTNGCTIKNNVVHDCPKQGTNDGSGLDMDQGNDNCLFEYNVAYNTGGGGLASFSDFGHNGNVWRFNLLVNCGTGLVNATGAMVFSGASDGQAGITIYNNTVISLQGNPGIWGLTGFSWLNNKKFYNNIFYNASGLCAKLIANATGSALDYNYYQSGNGFSASFNGTTYSTLASWQGNSGYDTHSLTGTNSPFYGSVTPIPAVVPGSYTLLTPYWLAANSVPLSNGANMNSTFSINPGTQDLVGNVLSAPFSMGAINIAFVAPNVRSIVGAPMLMTC